MSKSDVGSAPARARDLSEVSPVIVVPPLSARKLYTMYLTTGGLYAIPWFLRVLRSIEEHAPGPGAPARRTLAFSGIPIGIVVLQVVMRMAILPFGYLEGAKRLLYSPEWLLATSVGLLLFALGTRQFYELVHGDVERHRNAVGGLIYLRHPVIDTAGFAALWMCWMLPNPFRYVALLSAIPVRQVQVAINNYLDVVAHTQEERRFSRPELAAAILGGAVMLWLIGGAAVRLANIFESTSVPGYNG